MRKVAWLVAVVVVLGIAGCGFLHPAGAGSTAGKKIVNVATTTKTYFLTAGGLKRSYVVIALVSGLPASAPVIVMLSGAGAPVSTRTRTGWTTWPS